MIITRTTGQKTNFTGIQEIALTFEHNLISIELIKANKIVLLDVDLTLHLIKGRLNTLNDTPTHK